MEELILFILVVVLVVGCFSFVMWAVTRPRDWLDPEQYDSFDKELRK